MLQHDERIAPVPGDYNLKDYEEAYRTFSWKEAEKVFSWAETGRVNMAYECIDRHCEGPRKNKVALYYSDPSGRDEKYTFYELKRLSNKFGNV
ncbi:MAG: acetate--CoA ligase, partial [Calditerricola sp.]|nr:acetate--CoA ligase [Calditerricola sp.]